MGENRLLGVLHRVLRPLHRVLGVPDMVLEVLLRVEWVEEGSRQKGTAGQGITRDMCGQVAAPPVSPICFLNKPTFFFICVILVISQLLQGRELIGGEGVIGH